MQSQSITPTAVSFGDQATGCQNSMGFLDHFQKIGFKFVEVLNWTSSAGDWQFIVSNDGNRWFIAEQVNRWPDHGFDYFVDFETPYFGNSEEVFEEINQMF